MVTNQASRLAMDAPTNDSELSKLAAADIGVNQEGESGNGDQAPKQRADSPGIRKLAGFSGLETAREALRARLDTLTGLRTGGKPVSGRANVVIEGELGSGGRALARLYGRCLAELGLLTTGTPHHLVLSTVPVRWVGQPRFVLASAFEEAAGGLLTVELDPAFDRRPEPERAAVLDALARTAAAAPDTPVVLLGRPPHLVDLMRQHTDLAEIFADHLRLEPYTGEQLTELVRVALTARGFRLAAETVPVLTATFTAHAPAGGVYTAHRLAERLAALADTRTVTPEDLAKAVPAWETAPAVPAGPSASQSPPSETPEAPTTSQGADGAPPQPTAESSVVTPRQEDTSPLVRA